jgi:hypothetical protein
MRIKKILAVAYCCLSIAVTGIAQADSLGTVEVVKDYRVDLLVKKQSQINKLSEYKNSKGEYKGYRLMVLNTNNRDLAYKTRTEILRYFPDNNVYMAYQSPYFKIKVGDFLKKEDAEKFKKELSRVLPQNSVFVMQDIINVKPEEEARLLEEVAQEESE